MTDTIRFPDELGRPLKTRRQELGRPLKTRRQELGLTIKDLAQRAGKVREVIYRIEAGDDVTLSSLLAVLGALGLTMRLEQARMPTMEEVAARFRLGEDEEDEDAA